MTGSQKHTGKLTGRPFRPITRGLYENHGPSGGRPNIDEVVRVVLLVLQQWYGLSDEETERQAIGRLSFRRRARLFVGRGFRCVFPGYHCDWLFYSFELLYDYLIHGLDF